MVAFDHSGASPASTTTRTYGACPERSREKDQRVLLETDYDGATESETDERYFVYGNYIDEVLLMHVIPAQAGIQDDYYDAHDPLYSPTVLFDESGTVLERYEEACPERSRRNAYGTVTIWDGTLTNTRSTSSFGNPYTFTGRRLDALDPDGTGGYQLNLMYYRARTYDPQSGRFMQRDPLGIDPAGGKQQSFEPKEQYTDGINIYIYVKDNPAKGLDSYGLSCKCEYDSFAVMGTIVVPYRSSVDEVNLVKVAAQQPAICTDAVDMIWYLISKDVLSSYVDAIMEDIMRNRGVKVYFRICEWKCRCKLFRGKVSVFDKCWLYSLEDGPHSSPFDGDGNDWWYYPLNRQVLEEEKMFVYHLMLDENTKIHTCFEGSCMKR